MGSTNGTFVNGEKITGRARLTEGDRILVGTSIIKVVQVNDQAAATTEAEARRKLEAGAARHSSTAGRPMSGVIEEIPLPDLLQLLSTSRKSGVLSISSGGLVGKIYLRKGQIYYATIDESFDLSPMKAAYRILTWDKGTFELDSAEEKQVLEEINDSTEGLLMEGMRLLDEYKRIEEDLPPLKAPLQIPRPLDAQLSALKPPELEVFQIVLNGGTTQTVLDKSKKSDADAAQILIELIKREYIATR